MDQASLRRFGAILLLTITLSGCGGDDEVSDDAVAAFPGTEYDIELSGSVGDGPIVDARLIVTSISGEVLRNAVSDQNAGYNIQLKTRGRHYPLTIEARGGTDIVTNRAPDFTLYGAATSPGRSTVANINPFTTIAVETARRMSGGFNTNNLNSAMDAVVAELNSGLPPIASFDPMRTRIDDSNLALIVKASETLAEILRRTRAQASGMSPGLTVGEVIDALAADLVDGAIDGRGASGTSAHIAATAILASSQVVVESMMNELRVDTHVVTPVLDDVVVRLSSGSASPTSAQAITTRMIDQAHGGIRGAAALASSSALQTLESAVATLTAGMLPVDVKSILPQDASESLEPALLEVSTGSTAAVETVLSWSDGTGGDGSGGDGTGGDDPGTVDPGTGDPGTGDPGTDTNTAPVISGTPAESVFIGSSYRFAPTASDANGDVLTFRISGKPGWASFDLLTGVLRGAPTSTGTHSDIVISVSDGAASASLAAFSITVSATTPPNSPPTISGSPATSVSEGSPYTFRPSASDPDGDTLTFRVSNLPSWAAFSTSTGRLGGTPSASDVGTFSNVGISVTDGLDVASLPAFSITVEAAATVTGSATLTWNAPSENTDGTPFLDLAGYKVYWGTSPRSYTHSSEIPNPGVTTYVIENLGSGTYYFSTTALSESGLESTFSNELSKTIP